MFIVPGKADILNQHRDCGIIKTSQMNSHKGSIFKKSNRTLDLFIKEWTVDSNDMCLDEFIADHETNLASTISIRS